MLKSEINLASPLQVGAPSVPLRRSHGLINASGCTLGSLTFLFCTSKVRKNDELTFQILVSLPTEGR